MFPFLLLLPRICRAVLYTFLWFVLKCSILTELTEILLEAANLMTGANYSIKMTFKYIKGVKASFVYIIFGLCVCVAPDNAQGLCLDLHSEITPGDGPGDRGPYWTLGIEPWLTAYKANKCSLFLLYYHSGPVYSFLSNGVIVGK